MNRRWLNAALVWTLVGAHAANAQAIHGSVRDALTNLPVSGVVVLALDSASAVRSRVVSSAVGEYRVVTGPFVRTLRFVRIGFAPEERSAPASDTGAVRLDVTMHAVSRLLDAVQVRANPNCPRRADGDLAFSLWEQARAALLAAVVARETNPPRAVRLAYKRVLSFEDRIAQQLVQVDSTAVTTRPFVAVLSSEDFVRGGFARDTSGMRKYLVPYADALLEEAFATGHCFGVRGGGEARRDQVGLVFETARRQRGRVDVDGVIWVDTAARTLVDLAFRYVGLSDVTVQARPGGEIGFRQMANGLLVIDRWHIRGSGARERPPHDELGVLPPIDVPIVATEYGGEVVEATWPDGSSWHARLGKLALRAVDASGQPMAGAEVRLRGTNYFARTNSNGVVDVSDLLPGPYVAVVNDSLLGRVGLASSVTMPFTVQRGGVVEKRVMLRAAMQNFREYCSTPKIESDEALLVVRVKTPDGTPVYDASWELRRERRTDGEPARVIGPGSPVIAEGPRTAVDGTLDRCLKLKKGDTVRVKVWRDGQPAVTEDRVLENDATVIGLILPSNRR